MSLEEQEKFYKNFGGFHVFVFRHRLKKENAELAESVLHHVLLQVRLPKFQEKVAKVF